MRISDWSSDVCSSDLPTVHLQRHILRHGGSLRVEVMNFLLEENATTRRGRRICRSAPAAALAGYLRRGNGGRPFPLPITRVRRGGTPAARRWGRTRGGWARAAGGGESTRRNHRPQ